MSELNMGAIFISKKILVEKEPPCYMYREEPENEGDSGWRVFSGTDNEDYTDNPLNFKLVTAEQLIKIDESLKANLLAPYGFAFERNPDTKKWMIAKDF